MEGISDDVLQYYLGHFPTSVKPGEVGNFAVAGTLKEDLPEVSNVYETTTEKDGKSYNTAIITCQNGEGYEFNLGMINR